MNAIPRAQVTRLTAQTALSARLMCPLASTITADRKSLPSAKQLLPDGTTNPAPAALTSEARLADFTFRTLKLPPPPLPERHNVNSDVTNSDTPTSIPRMPDPTVTREYNSRALSSYTKTTDT